MPRFQNKISTQKGVVNVLLIIVGLILSAILVGLFASGVKNPFGGSPAPVNPVTPPVTTTTTVPPINPICGLTVTAPQPNQTVGQGFLITGTQNGCGWVAFEAVAGTVQAIKIDGTPISAQIPIVISGNWMQLPINFQVALNLTSVPPSGSSGFLVFKNDDLSGENPKTIAISVKF